MRVVGAVGKERKQQLRYNEARFMAKAYRASGPVRKRLHMLDHTVDAIIRSRHSNSQK